MSIKREKHIAHTDCNCNADCNCHTLPNGCECTPTNKCSDNCTCGDSASTGCDCGCGSSDCECNGDCSDDPDGRHRDLDRPCTISADCDCGTIKHCHDSNCDCDKSSACIDNNAKQFPESSTPVPNKDSGCACGKCMDTPILEASSRKSRFTSRVMIANISRIVISVILILFGSLLPLPKYADLPFFLTAYLCIGGEYIYIAIRNVFRGKVFNENFLMVLATVGAFAIGEYLEAVLVMELYFIGEMLQEYAVDSSRRNISGLLNIKAATASKLVGNALVTTNTEELAIGDTIVIAAGEKVATDGIIISGTSYLDTTALTGESKLRSATIGDEIQGGTINTSGSLTMQVTKPFNDTSVAKILALIEQSQDKKPTAEKFITKFAKYYTPAVVLIAAIIAFIPPIFLGYAASFITYLNKALVFLVISCPCALVISIPLGFFAGIGGASRKSILIKGGNHLESVNTIDTYLFDKTGTLTEGVFDITAIKAIGITNAELLEVAAYAENGSNHPIAQSITNNYSGSINVSRITDYREISGKGIALSIDNTTVLCGNMALLDSENVIFLDSDIASEDHSSIDTSRPNNSSLLGGNIGGSVIHIARGGIYIGSIELGDRIRTDSAAVISSLLASGKRVIMLSGDNYNAAYDVAAELNIAEFHHSLLPEDKAAIVETLIKSGRKVAFVGDGLNDAPVLKLATLGICMSGLNNDASIEASDIVISGGKIGAITTLITKAKRTRRVVSQNIIFSLTVKLAIMIISVAVFSSMWLAILADVGVSLLAILNSLRAQK